MNQPEPSPSTAETRDKRRWDCSYCGDTKWLHNKPCCYCSAAPAPASVKEEEWMVDNGFLWFDGQVEMEPRKIADAHNASVSRLQEQIQVAVDFAEWGWTIIANSSGGDWEKEAKDWQEAAAKYRDEFHNKIRHLTALQKKLESVQTPFDVERRRVLDMTDEERMRVATKK